MKRPNTLPSSYLCTDHWSIVDSGGKRSHFWCSAIDLFKKGEKSKLAFVTQEQNVLNVYLKVCVTQLVSHFNLKSSNSSLIHEFKTFLHTRLEKSADVCMCLPGKDFNFLLAVRKSLSPFLESISCFCHFGFVLSKPDLSRYQLKLVKIVNEINDLCRYYVWSLKSHGTEGLTHKKSVFCSSIESYSYIHWKQIRTHHS